MKEITLEQTINLLNDCAAVIWGEGFLCYPSVDEDDEEFLYLKTDGEDGEVYFSSFNKKDNKSVKLIGSSLVLIDEDGEEREIILLDPLVLEA